MQVSAHENLADIERAVRAAAILTPRLTTMLWSELFASDEYNGNAHRIRDDRGDDLAGRASVMGRHATQAILHDGNIYLASGSRTRGATEVDTQEIYVPFAR